MTTATTTTSNTTPLLQPRRTTVNIILLVFLGLLSFVTFFHESKVTNILKWMYTAASTTDRKLGSGNKKNNRTETTDGELRAEIVSLRQQLADYETKVQSLQQQLREQQIGVAIVTADSDSDASANNEKPLLSYDVADSSSSSSTSTSLPPRLELLHIQKNAGSLLETMALQNNIPWGTCHFDFPWKPSTSFQNCPPLKVKQRSRNVYWHYPLQQLQKESFQIFPYDNHLDDDYIARPKHYFAVIRNPYERMLSMFYYSHRGSPRKTRGERAKLYLNKWVQSTLQPGGGRIVGLLFENSTICQYQYVYDHQKKMVEHVVQFEYLAEEFNPLARQYGLNMSIPDHKTNAHNAAKDTLTVGDFDNVTIHMMNTVCDKDFALGRGYEKLAE